MLLSLHEKLIPLLLQILLRNFLIIFLEPYLLRLLILDLSKRLLHVLIPEKVCLDKLHELFSLLLVD